MAKTAKQTETATQTETSAPVEAGTPGVAYWSKHRGYLYANTVQFAGGKAVVTDPAMIARMDADPQYGIEFFRE